MKMATTLSAPSDDTASAVTSEEFDTTRQTDHRALEADLVHTVGDEAAQQTGYEAGVNRERAGGGVGRSLSR